MKIFHVYDEACFQGLVKNDLINEDTGFKIQHAPSMENAAKFNCVAAGGTVLHSLLKQGKYPFYVDRQAGGLRYHPYDFDKRLIDEYREMLGDWFLGFQLQEMLDTLDYKCWYYETAKATGTTAVPREMPDDEIPERFVAVRARLKHN